LDNPVTAGALSPVPFRIAVSCPNTLDIGISAPIKTEKSKINKYRFFIAAGIQ
jgi:hypothetical protein